MQKTAWKFTPERKEKIIDGVLHNVPYDLIAPACGISERTLTYWIAKGKDDIENSIESEFAQFFLDIRSCELTKLKSHLTAIESMERGWQSRAWILTRRYAKHFGEHALQLEELTEKVKVLEELLKKKATYFEQNNETNL